MPDNRPTAHEVLRWVSDKQRLYADNHTDWIGGVAVSVIIDALKLAAVVEHERTIDYRTLNTHWWIVNGRKWLTTTEAYDVLYGEEE